MHSTLKHKMTQAHVLALPDFAKQFIVDAETCAYGIRAVLMHGGRPISFFSKIIFPRASALSTCDKEAMAIIEALTKMETLFCYFFLDHKNSSTESQVHPRAETERGHSTQAIGQITGL